MFVSTSLNSWSRGRTPLQTASYNLPEQINCKCSIYIHPHAQVVVGVMNSQGRCSKIIFFQMYKKGLKQCARYKFLPSGLCAEICCNRGKKGLSGRIGTFSGPILEQIGTFCRYLHQNAELLKIMRKHDNPISRPEKVH